MAKCSFCRSAVTQGTGMLLIKNDGRLLYFCAKKCEKNLIKLGRVPRKVRWTKTHALEKKQQHKE